MICEGDCLNCPYPDCIDDSPPRQGEDIDEYIRDARVMKKKAWRRKNRDRIREYNALYYDRRKEDEEL